MVAGALQLVQQPGSRMTVRNPGISSIPWWTASPSPGSHLFRHCWQPSAHRFLAVVEGAWLRRGFCVHAHTPSKWSMSGSKTPLMAEHDGKEAEGWLIVELTDDWAGFTMSK